MDYLSVFDVPAGKLLAEIAADLRKQGIQAPEWAAFVKTGTSRERAPDNRLWFYVRLASVLYRVFKEGPLGTESLRTYYGGKKNKGTKRHHFRKASGKIVRTCLQTLEKQGYVKKEKKGRVITGKGHSYLNRKAKEVAAALAKHEALEGKQREEKPETVEGQKAGEEKRVAEELRRQEEEKRLKLKEAEKERKKEEKKAAERAAEAAAIKRAQVKEEKEPERKLESNAG